MSDAGGGIGFRLNNEMFRPAATVDAWHRVPTPEGSLHALARARDEVLSSMPASPLSSPSSQAAAAGAYARVLQLVDARPLVRLELDAVELTQFAQPIEGPAPAPAPADAPSTRTAGAVGCRDSAWHAY